MEIRIVSLREEFLWLFGIYRVWGIRNLFLLFNYDLYLIIKVVEFVEYLYKVCLEWESLVFNVVKNLF